MKDIFGKELPEEGTILKVDQFVPKPAKKEGENNWIPKYKGRKLRYKNRDKDIVISGAVGSALSFANAVEYKRVCNPEMFCGDVAEFNEDSIRGFAWMPTVVSDS